MNRLLQKFRTRFSFLYVIIFAGILVLASGCTKEPPQPVLKVSTLASGLRGPIGVEVDKSGNVWVTESGSGKNDGKIVVITQDGKKYDAITGFESIALDNGEVDGLSHILFHDGLLYILGPRAKMYKANVSAFKPGNTPLMASSLGMEDIGTFVLAYNFKVKTNESHPYDLTAGPGGSLYITDAGANAVLKREKTGALSVLAEVPGIPNPTPVGPPQIESVPTGIFFDGQNFLVTTLLGFPFPPGKAMIYKVSLTGDVKVVQQGFTSLVDIEKGGSLGRLVLEYGTFGPMGFAPKTGRLVWANGTGSKVLADNFNLPVGLKQVDDHTWYVTSLGDGSVQKVTYK